MIVIVEGARRTGKSTVISAMKRTESGVYDFVDRGLQEMKLDQQQANFVSSLQLIKFANQIATQVEEKEFYEPIFVFDRFHISELIFGKHKRGYETEENFKFLDEQLAKSDAVLILLVSSTTSDRCFEEERYEKEFTKAFNESKIKYKIRLSLDDTNGKFTVNEATKLVQLLDWYNGGKYDE